MQERIQVGSKAATIFGRNPDNTDVLVEHPSISRRHAAVLHDGKGGLVLYDFGSTHGTYVDGKRVLGKEEVPLQNGSRIKFAESSRTYVLKLPGRSAGGLMMPPPPAAKKAASVAAGAAAAEEEAAVVPLDQALLESMPMSFGGSRKPGANKALSKDAMAAGIAEMMRQIQDAESKQEQAAEKGGEGEGAEGGEGDEEDKDDDEEEESDDDFGPRVSGAQKAARAEEPEPEPEESLATKYQVPMSHEANLRGHHKSITCLAMDPAGSRVAVGGIDYKVLLYDFGGMDRTHRPFRELEPQDGNAVVAVSWR